MRGTLKRLAGPAYLANAAANIFTPADSTIFTIVRHIHIANVTTAAVTFSLYVGATGGSAGGTELFKNVVVLPNACFDSWNVLRLDSTDYLSGLASASSSLTITVEGEQIVV